MLASEEGDGTLDTLRFSLASDIVELVVLTSDEAFLQTLREAVGGARRLWHVPSAEKVSDLLVAGEVGILVLDVQALNESATVFIGQIKRQFPDLVVVVAGHRDAEISIAGLISAGIVYRFIHKPMSPGRAKLFADAAVRKYDAQRKNAALAPSTTSDSGPPRGWLIGAAAGILAVIVVITWATHRSSPDEANGTHPLATTRAPAESPELAQAAAALAANRLTEPAGDNALELYLQAQARNPADPKARAGLAEVHERLLARAENALLEERLDEASAAIDTARKSGVESGRIAFLTAQLAKSREHIKAAQLLVKGRSDVKGREDGPAPAPRQATSPSDAPHLAATDTAAPTHIESGDSPAVGAHARAATATNATAAAGAGAGAGRPASADAWAQLLQNANDRLQQDRLIEPTDDSAKYYLMTLRGIDPSNAGLAPALQDLGGRLVSKARRALVLEQYDAARNWLDEATAVGFNSAEFGAVQRDLDAAVAKQTFLTSIVAANELTLVKSVQPVYPQKAELKNIQGWVELDFTVAESGMVKDIAVHAASTPGVFEDAAMRALSQWRYQPALRNAKPVALRARIRIRFSLAT